MLTEKYRPKTLNEVMGHAQNKNLVRAWFRTNRVPRAIMIHGGYSVGKTSLARIIGRSTFCSALADGGACGACPACQRFDAKTLTDYIEIDAGSDRGIDTMRSLAKSLEMLPLFGKNKVVVLDECQELTAQAWKAMLKTLEEPPSHVILILSTMEPLKVPVSIQSRCSQLPMRDLSIDDVASILMRTVVEEKMDGMGIGQAQAERIARVCHAHPRDALNALDQLYTLCLDAEMSKAKVDTATVNTFIEQVTPAGLETTAAHIVRAVLDGKPGSAIKRAEDNANEADALLSAVVALMRQAMLYTISLKLVDRYYIDALNDVALFELPDARALVSDVFSLFAQLRLDTAARGAPVAVPMDAVICRAAVLCQKAHKAAAAAAEPAPAAIGQPAAPAPIETPSPPAQPPVSNKPPEPKPASALPFSTKAKPAPGFPIKQT